MTAEPRTTTPEPEPEHSYAGSRIGELCSLRWRDVELAAGWLSIAESKTDAGARNVRIRGALRDELLAVRTATLGGAVKLANENLTGRGLPPLPDRLTPHSLRRTFASVLYALGESPVVVMAEMGHTTPALALRIYAQANRLGEDGKTRLQTRVEGVQLAVIGSRRENATMEPVESQVA